MRQSVVFGRQPQMATDPALLIAQLVTGRIFILRTFVMVLGQQPQLIDRF
jgi:hypothetical protein